MRKTTSIVAVFAVLAVTAFVFAQAQENSGLHMNNQVGTDYRGESENGPAYINEIVNGPGNWVAVFEFEFWPHPDKRFAWDPENDRYREVDQNDTPIPNGDTITFGPEQEDHSQSYTYTDTDNQNGTNGAPTHSGVMHAT
jgi:hypothetical protein